MFKYLHSLGSGKQNIFLVFVFVAEFSLFGVMGGVVELLTFELDELPSLVLKSEHFELNSCLVDGPKYIFLELNLVSVVRLFCFWKR